MIYKVFGDTIAVRIDRGEEVLAELKKVCEAEHVAAGSLSGIGAADHAVVGLYEVSTRQYQKTTLSGEMEITSLLGNVSQKDGEVYLHIHAAFADEKTGVYGGPLNECRISGTCELFIQRLNGAIGRKFDDAETGLNIFDF